MEITRDNIISYLQQMDNSCIRTNGKDFLAAASALEESFDYLIAENQRLLERLKRIEAEKFQDWMISKD